MGKHRLQSSLGRSKPTRARRACRGGSLVLSLKLRALRVGLVFVQMIAARIVIEMDNGIGEDKVTTVVPEVPVPEAVPAIPDDIIRLIMQFKHANFKKRFAAEHWPRRMQVLARKEAERRKLEQKKAICQMKCACIWSIVGCGVVLYLFLCGC